MSFFVYLCSSFQQYERQNMQEKIIGREQERKKLQEYLATEKSEFINSSVQR